RRHRHLFFMGDAATHTFVEGAANDSLDGGADNDKLDGGAGADTLNGGTGFDIMIGGDGNDVYFVDNIGDRINEAAKSTSGKDSVKSSIDYTLPVNVENLELTGLANLNGTGNADNNKITGNDGFDTLSGGDGDDTLNGGNEADTLIGGNGSDTYQINSKEDRIIETLNGGDQDVVESSISYQLDAFLEMLTLTRTKTLDGTGNDLANTIEGNTLNGEDGDDTLLGNGGDDTLKGGAGDDEIDGGEGDDLAVYTGNQGDYQITLDEDGQTWVIDGDEGTDRLTRIETLRFADGDIALAEFQANPSRPAANSRSHQA
ncbi:MAG: calcium-binding protein, partial [Methylococcaceae bacterium]